jgi:tetratricopeptide (TPR) repeat protein
MKIILIFISLSLFGTAQAERIKKSPSVWSQSYSLEGQFKYGAAEDLILPSINNKDSAELAYLRLGWLNYLQKNYRVSFDYYEKSLDINPNSIDAHLGMTLPLLSQKRYRTAIKHAEKALKLSPNNYNANAKLMHIYTLQGKWKKLQRFAMEVSSYYPSLVEPLVYVARASVYLGEEDIANTYFNKVLRLIPGHIEANAALDRLSANVEDYWKI